MKRPSRKLRELTITSRERVTSPDDDVSKILLFEVCCKKGEKILALIFAVLKFGQLSNNEQEVDDWEVRQTLCGDVYL